MFRVVNKIFNKTLNRWLVGQILKGCRDVTAELKIFRKRKSKVKLWAWLTHWPPILSLAGLMSALSRGRVGRRCEPPSYLPDRDIESELNTWPNLLWSLQSAPRLHRAALSPPTEQTVLRRVAGWGCKAVRQAGNIQPCQACQKTTEAEKLFQFRWDISLSKTRLSPAYFQAKPSQVRQDWKLSVRTDSPSNSHDWLTASPVLLSVKMQET